jgi:hypothetical protein
MATKNTSNPKPSNVLDLDELFGQARSITIKWQGEEYQLQRMEGCSPKEAVKFMQLQKKANKLKNLSPESVTDVQADQMTQVIDDMLLLVCPNFPTASMSFPIKMRAINFYLEQTQGKKFVEATLQKRIGAKPSAG